MVNQLGKSGSDVEHYHNGGAYYLEMNSECKWHVTVKGYELPKIKNTNYELVRVFLFVK